MNDSRRVLRKLLLLSLAGAAACIAACTPATTADAPSAQVPAGDTATAPSATPVASTALAQLTEAYFEDALKLFPTYATYLGDDRYNDRLQNSASREFVEALRAFTQRYHDAARSIDPAQLDEASRLTHEIFLREQEVSLEGLKYPDWMMPINQLDSMASTLAEFGGGESAQPFRSVRDFDNFLSRVRDFVTWTDSAIAGMREGLRTGVTQPRVIMAKVVPQLRNIAVGEAEKTLFWHPIEAMPESFTAAERERLTRAYREAINGSIVPAYRRLADFIETEYLPKARTSVGWSALPDGAAWYRFYVRNATTTDLSPEEIHQLGLAEVARIKSEMSRVRDQVGFKGNLQAFFTHLRTDPKFFYGSPAELLNAFRSFKVRVGAELPRLFADMPKADYEVREVEEFRAATAPGAFYQPPSADGKRPGIFYINTHNLKAQPRYDMETLSLHEAAPGHHFQTAIQQELTDLPKFRRYGNYVAYSEGWALYCESIGKELGVFTDPYQWFGRLNAEMLRAMRLVVDTGLHAKGWTREQAIAYMTDNSSMDEADAVIEVERYMVWPGQALGYKVGQLRISELRARAERALGARFDVKAFHSQVLRDGALPLAVLERKIDRWIAARR